MRNKPTIDDINAAYGKLPPQAIDAEKAVLGALILEEFAYARIERIITPNSFYKQEHVVICEAVRELTNKHIPVDLLQVTQFLKDNSKLDEVGGPSYITELTRNVSAAVHIEHHAKIIAQKFIQREIIRITSKSQSHAYDDSADIEEVLHSLHSELNNLEVDISGSILTPKEGMSMIADRIKQNLTIKSGVTGLPSGINSMDNFTGGFQYTDLIIIAAERSQGKTSLLITILNHLGYLKIPASLISFEMSFVQLLARMISQDTGVSAKRILSQQLINREITIVENSIVKDMPIFIDDNCPNTLSGTIASIRYLNKKHGVKFFGIDYIQLMKAGHKNREEDLGEISRELKNVAKELSIVIVALSQLSRGEKYGQKPTLGRLRGSGQIEEAADTVIFVYRPEAYSIDYMDDAQYESSKGKALLDIAKGRNIGVEDFIVRFEESTGLFHEDATDFDDLYNPDAFHEAENDEPF